MASNSSGPGKPRINKYLWCLLAHSASPGESGLCPWPLPLPTADLASTGQATPWVCNNGKGQAGVFFTGWAD